MKDTTRICETCQGEFLADKREVNRGNARYCSLSCVASRKRVATPNTECAYCGIPFYRSRSKLKASKSGLAFCCREHKDLAQRLGGIREIQPKHYGTIVTDYRTVAKRELNPICSGCGYDKVPGILEVHHKNHDRSDNSIDNLCYLCPNCHQEHHFNTKTGRYG